MSRRQILWLAVAVALAVFVAVQVVDDSQRPSELIAQADVPTVAPGVVPAYGGAASVELAIIAAMLCAQPSVAAEEKAAE